MRGRWIGVVLAAAVVLGGCSRGDGGSAEVTTVSFWYAYGGNNRKVTEELIAEFNRTHPTIRVEGTYQGDYFEALAKVRVAARTQRGPTVTHVVSEALPQLWSDGLLEPLGGYASGERGGEALDLGDFVPALTQEGTFDYGGQEVPLFALPFNRSTPIVYYNVRMLKAAGLEPPTTWAELESAAGKLTVREGEETQVWGLSVPVDWWFWYAMLHQAGGRLLSEDGKRAAFGGEAGQAALGEWVKLTRESRVMKHPPGRDYNAWEVANTDFLNERVAMIWTSTAFLKYFQENAKFEFETAPLPGRERKAVPTGGTFFVMLKGRPEGEKAAGWTFMRWMSEPAQAERWARATGYLPVRRSAAAAMSGLYAEDPRWKVAMDQLEDAVRFPFSPHLLEIQRGVVQPSLERPVVEGTSVEEVLRGAQGEADKVLARPAGAGGR